VKNVAHHQRCKEPLQQQLLLLLLLLLLSQMKHLIVVSACQDEVA
jgi:hypothetical protein